MKYIIKIKSKQDIWIAPVKGNPGRTLIKENAQVYETKIIADEALDSLESLHPERTFFIESI